jgi:hypothetical protein
LVLEPPGELVYLTGLPNSFPATEIEYMAGGVL